ncbi:MAG: hypothetical protein JNJ89_13380 [Rubrivivax sp.]|nr:hypothetical protein [Rubrivivax sp.]
MNLSHLSCTTAHDRLSEVDDSQSLLQLERSFQINDDLLQAQYPNGLTLDVGWFTLTSISNTEGPYPLRCFLVRLIRNADWTTPALQIVARDFSELRDALQLVEQWATGLKD